MPKWLPILLLALASCTAPKRARPQVRYDDLETSSQSFGEAAPRSTLSASRPASGGSGSRSKISASEFVQANPQWNAKASPDAAAPARRMVHYSGSATLRSPEPERVLDSAIARAVAAGGYLEQRAPGFASLRVPSGDFDSLFQALLRLAEVIDFNQQAEDISEAAQDTELRLKIVSATLERLEDLIRKARTEAQKLKLLKDLQRFREEREVLEARQRDLVQRARFASIRLTVRAHNPLAASAAFGRDPADFRWIQKLNPFDDGRFRGRWRVKFAAPRGMVVTRKWFPWRATSSEGAEFWGSEVEVDLRGDSRFWREAILARLGQGFKSADTARAGAFLFCRFQSFGPSPYFYWVGVRSRGDELDVAEFYFPGARQQEELLPGMLAAVERKSR